MTALRLPRWMATVALTTLLAAPVALLAQPAPDAGGNPPANNGAGGGGPGGGGNNPGQGQGGQGQGGQGQGGRGNFDPAQFRQRMLDRMKEQLGASDDEFAAIQPKLEAVFMLQRELNAGRMGGRRGGGQGGPGGNGGPGGAGAGGGAGGATAAPNAQTNPVQAAAKDLQTTLDNKDATADDIKAKLTAYRDAKAKVRDDLTKAQKELRDLLTQRQEAVLVVAGMLD